MAKAVRFYKAGGPEVLTLEDVDVGVGVGVGVGVCVCVCVCVWVGGCWCKYL